MRFPLTVDQGQSFSLTGTPLSKESEIRKLIASHETISTACVDLLLPCGDLEHESSQLKGSLGFFHFKKIESGHSPPLVQGSPRSFNDSKDKEKNYIHDMYFKNGWLGQGHYDHRTEKLTGQVESKSISVVHVWCRESLSGERMAHKWAWGSLTFIKFYAKKFSKCVFFPEEDFITFSKKSETQRR